MIATALGLAPLSDLDDITDITELLLRADGDFGLDKAGQGSFTVPYGTTLPYDPMGCMCWIAFEDELFAGFIVEGCEKVELDPGNEARMVTTYSGRGQASMLDRYRIQPTLAAGRSPWARTRSFSAFSPEYDFSGWDSATAYEQVGDLAQPKAGLPSGFPAFDVYWIGPAEGDNIEAPYGYWWTQTEFDLVDDSLVRIFYGVDDFADVYIDGFKLSSVSTDRDPTSGFVVAHDAIVYLSAGTHRIGARVVNNFGFGDPGYGEGTTLFGNPTCLALVGYLVNLGGQLGDRVVETSSAWKILSYPDDPPGMTDPEVLAVLVAESIALGADPEVQLSVSGTWLPQETITVRVGDPILKHLDDRVDAAAFDWEFYFSGQTPVLQILTLPYGNSGVEYTTANGNLRGLESSAVDAGTDSLLVAWDGGYVLVPDGGGERMGYLETRAATVGEAKAVGASVLAKEQQPERIRADVLPTSLDDLPGWNAYPGYTVTVGAHVDELLWAWSFDWSDAHSGDPQFGIEVKDKIKDREEQIESMLRRAAGGQMGGSAPSAPGAEPPELDTKINARDITFQAHRDDAGDYPTGVSDAKRPAANGNLYAVAATATGAASTDTEFELLVNGVDVLGGAGVLPAGDDYVLIPVDPLVFVYAGSSAIQANLITVGTGLDGLLIEPRFV